MRTFDLISHSKGWLTFSGLIVLASIICIAVFGLNFGIDFTGGSLLEVQFETAPSVSEVRTAMSEFGFSASVQESDTQHLIRFETISQEQHDVVLASLQERFGTLEELRFESIGPVIGAELARSSVWAVFILLVLIVLYVAWAFRKVSKPVASWKYGLLTIITAAHDVLIPLGVFAVLGETHGVQADTAFVAAILTIMGYSINDTIVVFDRTRENLISHRLSDASFASIVNTSVMQSMTRSINTSLTTVLVLLAILFFGGETTQSFVLALIIGIVAGAYSSLFVASPLLVFWERRSRK
jgi:preprotein translocase subunit SecF